MTVKISYLNKPIAKTSANEILFVDEKFNISKIKKFISNTEFSYINDLLKTNDLKKKILFFDVNSKKKLVLISIKKDLKGTEIENLGAELFNRLKHEKISEYTINSDSLPLSNENFLGYFLHLLKLK
jgi:leucyl aminopeptidase